MSARNDQTLNLSDEANAAYDGENAALAVIARLDAEIAMLNAERKRMMPTPFQRPSLPPLSWGAPDVSRFLAFHENELQIGRAQVERAKLLLADAEAQLATANAEHTALRDAADKAVTQAEAARKAAEDALAEAQRAERQAKEQQREIATGHRALQRTVDVLRAELAAWERQVERDEHQLREGERRLALRNSA
jgi:hypothetical protein